MAIELPTKAIQSGEQNWWTKIVNKDEVWIGIIEWHVNKSTGDLCGGWVAFDIPECTWKKKWTVNSYDPLDLSPSLQCTTCGNHGYIKQGKWQL